jgi:hypothetical protein
MIGRGLSISFSCAPSSPQRSRSSWRLDLDTDSISCPSRLEGEIGKRGIIDVLRNGVKHGQHDIDRFYGAPSPGSLKAAEAAQSSGAADRRHPPCRRP